MEVWNEGCLALKAAGACCGSPRRDLQVCKAVGMQEERDGKQRLGSQWEKLEKDALFSLAAAQ